MMKKKMEINIIFNMLKTITNIIFPLITFPYATRVLGAGNLGKVQYATSIIGYFTLLATLGISIYAVREGAKYKDDLKELSKFVKELLIINAVSLSISYFFLTIFIVFILKKLEILLLLVCSLNIIFQTFGIEWLYQIREDYVYISLRAFFVNCISIILMFIFVHNKNDYIIYALITVFSAGGSFVFNLLHAKSFISFSDLGKLEIKKHIRPIIIIFGISIASSIYINMDSVMLGAMVGVTAVGLYTCAVKLVQVVKSIISALSNVLFSRLSNYLGNGDMDAYTSLLDKGFNTAIMFMIPCIGSLMILSKDAVVVLGGSEYAIAAFASEILALNLLFSVVDGFLYYQILLPFKKDKEASISTCLGAGVNLILNFLFIPRYSYNGAAFATLIAEMFVFFNLYRYSKQCINLKLIFKYVIKYAMFSIPTFIVCFLLKMIEIDSLVRIVVAFIIGVIIYLLILIIFKDKMIVEEIDKVKRVLNEKRLS